MSNYGVHLKNQNETAEQTIARLRADVERLTRDRDRALADLEEVDPRDVTHWIPSLEDRRIPHQTRSWPTRQAVRKYVDCKTCLAFLALQDERDEAQRLLAEAKGERDEKQRVIEAFKRHVDVLNEARESELAATRAATGGECCNAAMDDTGDEVCGLRATWRCAQDDVYRCDKHRHECIEPVAYPAPVVPVQEPVAYRWRCNGSDWDVMINVPALSCCEVQPLYAAPVAEREGSKRETTGWLVKYSNGTALWFPKKAWSTAAINAQLASGITGQRVRLVKVAK
jgi:hypothetical protein